MTWKVFISSKKKVNSYDAADYIILLPKSLVLSTWCFVYIQQIMFVEQISRTLART